MKLLLTLTVYFQGGTNHSSVTENGMKTLDVMHRKSDSSEANHTNHIGNGHSSHADSHARSSHDPAGDILSNAQPPPQEFFVRIRGMITAAKTRLNNFRYKPTLLVIPEDDYFYQDFKEKDMEVSGNRKSAYKKFSKKGNNSALPKLESIHGSNLGAAMLEAKLAPPLPPPRNAKPKNKKRAPSPPGERIPLPEYSRETPSPASLKELGGSLDRKTSRRMSSSVNNENYSKFDLFRLDLYEKIHRMREGVSADNDVVLDYPEGKKPAREGENIKSLNICKKTHKYHILLNL